MIDSWPRLLSGLTRKGAVFLLGDYDICQNLWSEDVNSSENTTSDEVHYCSAKLEVNLVQTSTAVTTGFCLPTSCSADAVKPLAIRFLDEFVGISEKDGAVISVENAACHGRDEEWTYLRGVLTTIVLSILVLLITATVTDCYMVNRRAVKIEDDVGDGFTFSGSDSTDTFAENDALRRTNYHEVPSLALTYKDMPDLSHSLSRSSVLLDVLYSFSLRNSLNHLSRKTAKEIPCLNGLKVLSILWVILGHSCLFTLPYIDNLNTFLPTLTKSRLFAPLLLNSSLAVDSFLFISGTITAFSLRKRILFRDEYDFSVLRFAHRSLMLYFHRITRLWPSLLVSTLFIRYVYNHLGDGPVWSTKGIFGTTCSFESMWPHLLFFSNW
ncbi:hypothetical protein OESDEN_20309, partial [Oesophagostomum dentatum]